MHLVDSITDALPFLTPFRRFCGKVYAEWCIHMRWRKERKSILDVRHNYDKLLLRARETAKNRKLRVLFLFNENSKWKCQSVYDSMVTSDCFEPIIALTKADIDWKTSKAEFVDKFELNRRFCRQRGMDFVEAYSFEEESTLDLAQFSPDIVFYQHPWDIAENQKPQTVSRFALTCYIPYYIVCYDAPFVDSQQELHKYVWRYFLLNDEWVKYFNRMRRYSPIAGVWVAAGHPMLDIYGEMSNTTPSDGLVIYAPHWSITGTGFEHYSTFLENGREILDYAKKHREIKWCFKPHPSLRMSLKNVAKWSDSDISSYYDEWEKLGEACYDGEYPKLFERSRAMITDCSSFLMEYAAVNKPLIHLVSSHCCYEPAKPSKALFESFYQVHDMNELQETFKMVLEAACDPKKTHRSTILSMLNLCGVNAASEVLAQLRKEIKL